MSYPSPTKIINNLQCKLATDQFELHAACQVQTVLALVAVMCSAKTYMIVSCRIKYKMYFYFSTAVHFCRQYTRSKCICPGDMGPQRSENVQSFYYVSEMIQLNF